MSPFGGRLVYSISIRIADPPPALRPDMKVNVEIDVADLDDVLTVPAKAVLAFEGKLRVAVKKTGGEFE